MERAYAFFDFDGTLIPGDSIAALTLYAYRRGWMSRSGLLKSGWAALLYGLHLLPAEASKERALRFLQGKTQKEAARMGREFCRDVLSKRLYPEGLQEMKRLRREGVEVWVVSASPEFYLRQLGLPADRIVATRLQTEGNGRLNGKIFGENCRGVQKPLRLAELLSSLGDEVDYDASRAYGDSAGDIPMLELCRNRFCVNAKRKLRKKMRGRAQFLNWGKKAPAS